MKKPSLLHFARPLLLSVAVAAAFGHISPAPATATAAVQPHAYGMTLGVQHVHRIGLPVLITPAVAAPATSAAPSGIPNSPTTAAAKVYMLELINAERAQNHLKAITINPTLAAVAQQRSQDMITRHYFSHQIPGGGMVFDILDRQHVNYQMAGENLALNNYIKFYSIQTTINHTNTDLMNSPEHRANLLQPSYSQIGIGVAFDPTTGRMIVTEVFLQP